MFQKWAASTPIDEKHHLFKKQRNKVPLIICKAKTHDNLKKAWHQSNCWNKT